MAARAVLVTLLARILLAPGVWGASADPAITGYPDSIAALGDSITQATNSDALGDQPQNSWATGTNPSVNSVYTRLLAVHPAINGNRFNDSVSGAQMVDLDGQAQNAVSQGTELVVILMGANDVCTPTEASMTPVATFRSQFEAAVQTLSAGLPDARIGVASIPDIYNLWSILKDDPIARSAWRAFSICQSMLANPLSNAPADVLRRANVSQRNMDFNDEIADVCGEHVHCRFDNYAGFNTQFTPAHVSTRDYFHPSLAGLALAANVGWGVFDLTDVTPPVSASVGAVAAGGADVTLQATDNTGVSGLEYRFGAGPWQRYVAPVFVASGSAITWRAVDVNGNSGATQACLAGAWSWPANDDDCDGFESAREASITTDPGDACGFTPGAPAESDTWPADLVESNSVNISDVLAMKPLFGQAVPPASARYDIAVSGAINIADVLMLKPYFGAACNP